MKKNKVDLDSLDLLWYSPNYNELEDLKSKVKRDKSSSIIFAIVWNAFIFFGIFIIFRKNMEGVRSVLEGNIDINILLIAAPLIFVIMGIVLLISSLLKLRVSIDNFKFTKGVVVNTRWVHKDYGSDNTSSNYYYAEVIFDSLENNMEVEISYSLYRNLTDGDEIILAWDRKNIYTVRKQ